MCRGYRIGFGGDHIHQIAALIVLKALERDGQDLGVEAVAHAIADLVVDRACDQRVDESEKDAQQDGGDEDTDQHRFGKTEVDAAENRRKPGNGGGGTRALLPENKTRLTRKVMPTISENPVRMPRMIITAIFNRSAGTSCRRSR